MNITDKRGILGQLDSLRNIRLEIGCGPKKKIPGAIGIDALDYDEVDIVGDAFDVLRHIPDSCVDGIHSFHFLEHVYNLQELVDEFARILKPAGDLEIVVPHFSNPYFYSDPTHRIFFGLYTFCYYADESLFERKVPVYQKSIMFELIEVNLGFKSSRPFWIRHAMKKIVGWFFNSNNFMKEFYEENLSHIFPCYEIRYRLRRK